MVRQPGMEVGHEKPGVYVAACLGLGTWLYPNESAFRPCPSYSLSSLWRVAYVAISGLNSATEVPNLNFQGQRRPPDVNKQTALESQWNQRGAAPRMADGMWDSHTGGGISSSHDEQEHPPHHHCGSQLVTCTQRSIPFTSAREPDPREVRSALEWHCGRMHLPQCNWTQLGARTCG